MAQKQLTAIEVAANHAVAMLAEAATKATSAIADAALSATKLLAVNASETAKVTNVKISDDHDTIITLVESVANLDRNVNIIFNDIKRNIKDLQDNTTQRISDLEKEKINIKDSYPTMYKAGVEKRLDSLEIKMETISDLPLIRKLIYGAVSTILLAVLSAIVYLVVNK